MRVKRYPLDIKTRKKGEDKELSHLIDISYGLDSRADRGKLRMSEHSEVLVLIRTGELGAFHSELSNSPRGVDDQLNADEGAGIQYIVVLQHDRNSVLKQVIKCG